MVTAHRPGIVRRIGDWLEDRTGVIRWIGELARHPIPPQTDWRYVLGSATLVAFLIQVATGIALATMYVPSTADAYRSLQYISQTATLGRVLRGMHYFGAGTMVVLIGAHMARVYLMGSYKFPREMNWLTGTVLFACTMLMAFTGQLLRWDQNGVWSVVVAGEQAARVPGLGRWLAWLLLGGTTVGAPTLTRSFVTHVFLIPAVLFIGVAAHLALVIRAGISEPPSAGPRTVDPATYRAWYHGMLARVGRPFWPDAAWRDAVMAVAVVAVVLALAIVVGPAPLGKPPDPTIVEADPRPDWYFIWYFAVLAVLPRRVESIFIVGAPLAFVLALVLLPLVAPAGRRRIRDRPWAVLVVAAVVSTIGWFWHEGQIAPWSPRFDAPPLAVNDHEAAPAAARGARLFHDKGCEYCHTVAGVGGLRGPNLTSVATHLTRPQIESQILGGGPDMPAYVWALTPDELQAIIAFLETPPAPPRVVPAEPARQASGPPPT